MSPAPTQEPVEVDVVVVGLGAGGELAASRLARAGLRVVAVESHLVGGECPFFGCTPTKLGVRAADLVAEVRRAARLAGPSEVRPDWSRVAARIREANHDWHDDHHVEPLERSGVTVVRGRGRLDGPGQVQVETEAGTSRYPAARGVLLDTGTRPAVPPVAGLAQTPYWTNRDLVRLTELPDRLVVLGAGAIGSELAQLLARFGVTVTLLEAAGRVLPAEEPEAAAVVTASMRADGIDVRTGVAVDRVDHDGSVFSLRLGEERFETPALLVATGREPNLDDLGLEPLGVERDADGRLRTDERMRVLAAGGDVVEGLWAVGDITGHGEYTHLSLSQAATAVHALLGQDGPWADHRAVSRVTFTDPEVGAVGLTEAAAREAGLAVRTGSAEVQGSSRGWIHGPGADGVVKLVVDRDRGVLVGGTAVGPTGGEVVGLLAVAVHAAIPVSELGRMHFAYPTFHRVVLAALQDLVRTDDAPGPVGHE